MRPTAAGSDLPKKFIGSMKSCSRKACVFVTFVIGIGYLIISRFFPPVFRMNKRRDMERFQVARPKTRNRVGMLTMLDIIPEGSERYFLTSVVAFQSMGFHVDILVKSDNKCSTMKLLKATARYLRVNLDYDKLSFEVVEVESNRLESSRFGKAYTRNYDIFFLMGNEKFPEVYGLASNLNVYMCQFPFDFDKPGDQWQHDAIRSYDIVLLNSQYTFRWYADLIQPAFDKLRELGHQIPTVQILHPPVYPLVLNTMSTNNSSKRLRSPKRRRKRGKIVEIVVSGVVSGGQSKVLDLAISMLDRFQRESSISYHLTFVCNVQPSQKIYDDSASLKANVSALNVPVSFITDVDSDDVFWVLSKATVFWHLSGFVSDESRPVDDPAVVDHFGVSVIEAMSSGCIPIVSNIGGALDIIDHGLNGFIARTVEDYILFTLQLVSMSEADFSVIRESAMSKSEEFHATRFTSKLATLAHRAVLSHPLRRVIDLFAAKRANVSSSDRAFTLNIGPGVHTSLGALFATVFNRQTYYFFPISLKQLSAQQSDTALALGISAGMLQTGTILLNDGHESVFSQRFPTNYAFRINIDSIPLHDFRSLSIAASPSQYSAVIIEPTISSAFEFSVRTTMYHLGPRWGLQVFHSLENREFVRSVLSDMKNVVFIQLRDPIVNVAHYNRLLKSRNFWKSLQSEKVLLIQSDSVVLRGNIDEFIEYDYVGAPWEIKSNMKVKRLRDDGWLSRAVGNGGFSLRNVAMMIMIIDQEVSKSPAYENEDIFFSKHIQFLKGARVSSETIAYKFCKEEPIQLDSNGNPMSSEIGNIAISHFAFHAAWYYDRPDKITEALLSAISPAFPLY